MRRTPAVVIAAAIALTAGCTTKPTPPVPTPATASTTAAPAPSINAAQYAAGRSTPFADPIYPGHGNPGIDVLHYGLTLSWAPQTKTFSGDAVLTLRAVKALSEITLDFSPVYTVYEATFNGSTVTTSRDGEKLVVPVPLAEDALATLRVRYRGTPDGVPMPSHRGDIEDLGLTIAADGGLWTMQEPYGAFTWYPANDQPSDKALFDIAITVPDGWTGIANGTPAGRDGNTFRYTTTDPVATYLTTLAVGKYAKETATGPHGLPLTYWYRPAADKAMLPLLRRSPKYIEWLEARFGPYPFPSGGTVVVASQSAMETQQMITIGSFPAAAVESVDGDLLHEYAHQWFGDAVTPSSWKDVWLNEGWAMYAQLLYENERDHVGDAEFERLLRQRDALVRSRSGPPGSPRADSFAESNVYLCPALMLHEIHQAIGDKAFFAMARDWVQQHRDTVQDRASFIAFVNQHTGRDFTEMINRWLDSPTTPA